MKRILAGLMLALASFSASAALFLSIYIVTLMFESGELPAIQAKIASTAAACAAAPYRGTVHYFCDCGVGAEADCVAGSDANSGLDSDHPKQLIATATALENTFTGDTQHTIAFCKGGSHVASSGQQINRHGCTAGTTCDDWREYTPTTFTGTEKPILRLPTATWATLIRFDSSTASGGIRFLNLAFVADGVSETAQTKVMWFDTGAHHDVTVCNANMDGFYIPFYVNSVNGRTNNITLTGSTISNSSTLGFLGGGDNTTLSYNTWINNGGPDSLDHTLYLSGHNDGVRGDNNFTVIGNYIQGSYGALCWGAAIEGHGSFNGVIIKNNYITMDYDKVLNTCWGIEINNRAGYVEEFFYGLQISNNTIINTGNTGITVSVAPGAIIENNRISLDWSTTGLTGILIPSLAAKVGEPINDANVLRNNTIYFGPRSGSAYTNIGIWTLTEGTGHVISNNTVVSEQASGTFWCFNHDLSPAAYTFINNNHCYSSSVTPIWEHTHTTLSAWQTYSGFDMNSVTGDPAFTNPTTLDFHSAYLRGKGNSTYKSVNSFTGTTRPTPPAIGTYE